MLKRLACAAVAAALLTVPAFAQSKNAPGNLEKLSGFKSTGASMDIPSIDQKGDNAKAIKSILSAIKMPAGFKISLYAVVPDAREMTVGPQGVVTFVGTRKNKVYSVTDRNRDRVADEVKLFAPSIDFNIPNGVCFSKDGFLYIAEQNRVLLFPAAEFFYEGPDVAAFNVVKQGELIPVDEESYNHTARICRIGPDDKLYISLGQPFNVFAPEKMDLYQKVGMGGIIRMDRDGKNREVFATGIRNSVGMDFNPKDKTLWFDDNQVDGMGDEIPAGEMNRATAPGQKFGFPWYGGGKTRTNEYKDQEPPSDVVFPQVEFPAHAADLGWCKKHTRLPVIVKLTPNITDIRPPARAAKKGGADAVSLINTINSIMHVDLDLMTPSPHVDGKGTHGGYCGPAVKPIALSMVSEIARDRETQGLPISAIGGITTWRDAAEFLAMGAGTVQVCTAAMTYGFKIVEEMKSGLSAWMDAKGYASLEAFRGRAVANVTDWQYLNLNYVVKAEIDQDLCIKCGRCHIVCEDTSHQAITSIVDGARKFTVKDEECVGCNLCAEVCPVQNCITMVPRTKGKDPRTGEKYGKPYSNWTTHPNNPGALKAAE